MQASLLDKFVWLYTERSLIAASALPTWTVDSLEGSFIFYFAVALCCIPVQDTIPYDALNGLDSGYQTTTCHAQRTFHSFAHLEKKSYRKANVSVQW